MIDVFAIVVVMLISAAGYLVGRAHGVRAATDEQTDDVQTMEIDGPAVVTESGKVTYTMDGASDGMRHVWLVFSQESGNLVRGQMGEALTLGTREFENYDVELVAISFSVFRPRKTQIDSQTVDFHVDD